MRLPQLYIVALFGITGLCQPVEIIQPSRVLDVRALVKTATGRSDFVVINLAQNHGKWITSANFRNTAETILITGGDSDNPHISEVIDGTIDRVGLDPDGRIYTRFRQRRSGATRIEVRDPEFRSILKSEVSAAASLEPVPSTSGLYWIEGSIGKTIFSSALFAGPFRVSAGRIEVPRKDAAAPNGSPSGASPQLVDPNSGLELRRVSGIVARTGAMRWVQVSHLAEEVAVFEKNGTLVSRSTLDLDAAYRVANLRVPRRNPQQGIDRITWTATSKAGNLYVCLSDVPVRIPQPIAVFDPLNGHLVRLLLTVMPPSPDRRGPYNPDGFMIPVAGAVDDRIAVLDTGIGLLGVFSTNEREN